MSDNLQKYRVVHPEQFFDVEASSEAEAIAKAKATLLKDISDSDFIAWENTEHRNSEA